MGKSSRDIDANHQPFSIQTVKLGCFWAYQRERVGTNCIDVTFGQPTATETESPEGIRSICFHWRPREWADEQLIKSSCAR